MTREEAIAILKESKNRKYLEKAVKHENVIKFLSQFALNKADATNQRTYLKDFLSAVRSRLNNDDAFLNFENNITYPLQTNELIESMFNALKRIFEANDKYINFEFEDLEIKQDAQKYISLKWFQEEGWELFAHSPNTILVVDLPEIQNTELPEPFFYPLSISDVLEINVVENKIDYLIYCIDEDLILAIDKSEYLLLRRNKKTDDWDKLEELAIIPHSLGRCPANFLNNKNLYADNQIVKASPISKSLGEIMDLLSLYTNKNTLDNHILPHVVKYGGDGCDYDNGYNYCDNGLLKVKQTEGDDSWAIDAETHKFLRCPKCNKTLGQAETITVPTPRDKEEYDLAVNAITYVTPDTQIFEYSDKRINDKEKKIYNQVVGITQELNPKQQQNEVRVVTNLENQNQVLITWKRPFETSMERTNNDILIFRYMDKFLGSIVDLGTKFFLQTVNELYEEKQKAEESGLDNIINYDQQIIDVKYSNNPEQRKRSLLMLELSKILRPLNDKKPEDVDKLYLGDKITRDTYIRYTEFYSFINRFEIENNTQINEFELNILINNLKESFTKYISDYEEVQE